MTSRNRTRLALFAGGGPFSDWRAPSPPGEEAVEEGELSCEDGSSGGDEEQSQEKRLCFKKHTNYYEAKTLQYSVLNFVVSYHFGSIQHPLKRDARVDDSGDFRLT